MTSYDLKKSIKSSNIEIFLVDASGVLYNQDTLIKGAIEVTRKIREYNKTFFLVTNNSTRSIENIYKNLTTKGFELQKEHIISSGIGLTHDKEINSMMTNKKCYCVGYEDSLSYVTCAKGNITEQLHQADIIILLSSFMKNNEKTFEPLVKFITKNKEIPVICTNPDLYIYSKNGIIPVIGYYARDIEKKCNIQIKWIGKPHNNYSTMVKKIIETSTKKKITNTNTIFFDDNPNNVSAMVQDLNVQGCVVKDTGIYYFVNKKNVLNKEQLKNLHYISSFQI